MPELQLLSPEHAPAVLAFERENREFFAKTVPDRGDAYFDHFAERHAALLAEQVAGTALFHVLVGEDGEVLGRFNLYDPADGSAELGFRVAQQATGRGLATATVRRLFTLAADAYGLKRLTAAAARTNHASRTVLTRTGFRETGERLLKKGGPGITYVRELTGP
ncbi:GNAT family N-acetyltransferase [Streptomyces sp. VRA16 Mangrove soil]|uniref:GNAT family N-acetyltransferase n=1 Tax=Streptomyces sp. VRA16 Mangrove soil TaxID=2817434 RepID=UPI001A9E5229|nr:GNAT family N-acetyltransferase [Streptomyces sp. VRA16 Mangrove soil]MBO1336009.1 GNAT family N-acetyltransferase [Streptomyces sp. VRA16 Mangrove soil]